VLAERANVKHQVKTFLAGGLLASALFGAAMAGPLEDGQAAYQKGDYATALSQWRPLADQGNAYAQAALGKMNEVGQGVPQDDAQAVAWSRKAADQGFAPAQDDLGKMYHKGRGVPRDDAQAVAWFRRAADQGFPAQFSLGWMYRNGQGVAQDYSQAIAWYGKAADQGYAFAQDDLGWMYAQGQGVAQDDAQALIWFHKAADQGNAFAQDDIGWMYRNGQGVPQDYAQALIWLRKAADQGNAVGQADLGVMYRDGRGMPQDYVRAHMWLNLAAARSDDAMYHVAVKVRDDTRQMAIKVRDDVAAKMTTTQIAEAQGLAREWMRAHETPVTAPPISGMGESAVPLVSDGGTFKVPVTINGQLTLKFIVDSGATDVSIPADVVMTLLRTETITDVDFLDKQTYQLADGSTVPSQRFVIRTLKIGDKTLENVVGSIAPAAGSLLLGQSFLSRFKSWSIDNGRRALILNDNPLEQPTVSSPRPPEISGSSSPSRPPIPAAGEPQGGQSPPQSGQEPANPAPEAKNGTFLPSAARAAMLIATPDNPQKPVVNLGSTVWSTILAAPGQPETVAVKADADIPDLKMHASMTLRKNTDPTLQATHTIDLKFVFADGAPIAGFKDVGAPQMRKLDSTASEALTSVKVKVSDVYFLIALAKGDQDTSRNLGLMQTRAWFDFPLLLNDDRIAKLVFQKSSEGEAMLANASETWNKYASTPAPAAAPQADLPIPPDPFAAPQADAPISATTAKPDPTASGLY
jgi:TPR repeat protein